MGRSRVKKPTLQQKKLMQQAGLIPQNWLVIGDKPEELELVSKLSGKSRKVKK